MTGHDTVCGAVDNLPPSAAIGGPSSATALAVAGIAVVAIAIAIIRLQKYKIEARKREGRALAVRSGVQEDWVEREER